MIYKELDIDQIIIPPNSKLNLEVHESIILVPITNQRVFLNWFNEKGKLYCTHTLTKSVRINKNVTLVNSELSEIKLLKITETA